MVTAGPVRKLEPAGVRVEGPDLERVQGEAGARWVVRSFAVARQILRDPNGTEQAGFNAHSLRQSKMRRPILYQEGTQHRAQRRAAARFFAPAVIEDYQPMIARLSDALLDEMRADRAVDLSRLSMRLAVQVTGRVVGLTNSSVRRMSGRLATFFAGDPTARDRSPAGLLRTARTNAALLGFYWQDVKPAIRARRRRPAEDVISHLQEQDFSDLEILTEALTYAAAGMETAHGPVTIPAGEVIELQLRRTNADADVVGEEPDRLSPGRELPAAVPPVLLSFGDGHHRCPGGPLAILETDIFLRRLLALDLVAEGPPRVRWNPVSQGYDLDRFLVRLAS